MKSLKLLLLAIPLVSLLSACVINVGHEGDIDSKWEKRQRHNREEISTLELNTTEQSIRDRLGEPDFSEGYQDGDDSVHVLFYRTQRQEEDGITTKAECTPLVFRNGKLTGWGDKAYGRTGHPV